MPNMSVLKSAWASASTRHIALMAPLLVILSSASLYAGAVIAVKLFPFFPPFVVAWLRVSSAAIILLVLVRPRPAAWRGKALRGAVIYGMAAIAMNMAFYEAIARIPLGLAVALEFLGPILIAAVSSRTVRDSLSVVCAFIGVFLIAGVSASTNWMGLFFIGLAATMWAAYIVFGQKVSRSGTMWQSMTVGFCVASVVTSPTLLLAWGPWQIVGSGAASSVSALGWGWPLLVVAVFGLGLLSSAIPYGLDQVLLNLIPAGTFAVLSALLPLSASVFGMLFLGQFFSLPEWCGVISIMVAVVLRSQTRRQVVTEAATAVGSGG